MLRVRLFGNGQIFDDDAELQLRSRTWTLPLLAYVLLHRGEVTPRRRLAFLMWPDEAEEDALTKLRQNVHRLLKALPPAPTGDAWVSGGGHTISWNPSVLIEIDVAEFERLRTDEATLERAVACYSGDFLVELDDDWIAIERERLRRLYHADLSTLIRTHRSRRSYERAIHYASLMLVSDPWHEEALRALIGARYESGDASGALAEFDAFARRLRAEMDTDPMPETLALREAVARGAPISTTLDGTETSDGRPRETLSPFVGRAEDFAVLHGRWSRAARGAGGLTFVRGEAGIGKSRIVAELALTTESEGGRVLVGRTSWPEQGPYQCLSSAIRTALPLVAGVKLAPPMLAAIAELVPELRAYRDAIPEPVRLDPESERLRLLDALAQLFAELARPRPLLLILEDLHRAGSSTIEAIAGIVPRLSRSPILLVATCRPESVDRVHPLRRLLNDADGATELLNLGAMSADEIRLLVDANDGGEDISKEFFATLCRRSGGNPLFVTELMRDAERMENRASAIPESVNAMITERVASLAAASITVADVAAVAGEAFSVELVREVAQLSNDELLDGIDELLDRHLIRESTGRARYEYAFTHHLIHAAIYENVPADARLRRHRRIARILEETADSGKAGESDERAREIALHFERGGDSARAAIHYANAARRAASLHANDEARELLGRSLELGPGTDRERFDLLALRSKLNARLGDVDAEEADVSALEEIALRVDPDAVGAALLRRIDLAHRKANRERECEAIDRLRTHALATGSDRLFAAADEAQSKRAFQDGEIGSAIESANRARIRYEHIGDEAASARVTGFAAHASSEIYCNSAEWERLAYEALELAERVGDAETRLSALFHAASVACKISVDPPRAAELCRAALAIAVEIGDRVAEVRCHEQLGKTFFNDESYEEAAKQFTVALNLCQSLGLTEPLGNILCNLGAALSLNGVPSALDYLKRAIDEGLKKDAASTAALFASLNLMEAAWWRGDLDLMSTTLERCAPLVGKRTDFGYTIAAHDLNVGRLLRCRHEFDASARELEKLAETLDDARSRGDTRLSMMLAEVYDDLALTYLGSGRLADARLALNRNAEISRKAAKQQWTLLEHHWIDACVSRAQGRLGDARLALGRAHTIYRGRLDKIVDPGVRASYEARPVNRALRLALEHDQWPAPQSPCAIAFPDPASASEAMRTSSAIA